jgi:iron-sulfur cluster assembly protein
MMMNSLAVAALIPPGSAGAESSRSEGYSRVAGPEAARSSPGAALPDGVREGNENLVLLTEPAGKKVATLIAREQQGEFLRVAISGGGCNGLSYKMKFVPAPKRGDILVRTAGVRVLVDSKSALYIKGTHVDYSNALVAGGFKFSNPNAKASCSCGESFSV